MVVHDSRLVSEEGSADRHIIGKLTGQGEVCGEICNRRFSQAIDIEEPGRNQRSLREKIPPFLRVSSVHHFTAGRRQPHAFRKTAAALHGNGQVAQHGGINPNDRQASLPTKIQKRLRGIEQRRGPDNEGGSRAKRRKNLFHRGIEAQGTKLQNAVPGPNRVAVDIGIDEMRKRPMLDHTGLGFTGASRGVDQIGQIFRFDQNLAIERHRPFLTISEYDILGELPGNMEMGLVRDHAERLGIPHGRAEAVQRHRGFQRNVGRTRLEHTDHCGGKMDSLGQQQRKGALPSRPVDAQLGREEIRAAFEGAIGHDLHAGLDRDGIRRIRCLVGNAPMNKLEGA